MLRTAYFACYPCTGSLIKIKHLVSSHCETGGFCRWAMFWNQLSDKGCMWGGGACGLFLVSDPSCCKVAEVQTCRLLQTVKLADSFHERRRRGGADLLDEVRRSG